MAPHGAEIKTCQKCNSTSVVCITLGKVERGINRKLRACSSWRLSKAMRKASYMLGNCYWYGQDFRDGKKAIKWYTLAANQGHLEAQFMIGDIHYYDHGERDYQKARDLYLKAADRGHEHAKRRAGRYLLLWKRC